MANHGAGVNVRFVFYYGAAYQRAMRINAIPIPDAAVMTNNRVGLNQVVFPHFGICADGRKSTYYRIWVFSTSASFTACTFEASVI